MGASHVTNITFEKKGNKGALSATTRHNERLGDKSTWPKHIDQRRTHLNQTIAGNDHVDIYAELVERITKKNYKRSTIDNIKKEDLRYQDGRKVYDNAVLAFETVMQYPGDLVWCKLSKIGEPCRVDGIDEIKDIRVDDVRATEHSVKGYFLWPKNMNEFNNWARSSVDYLNDKFGEKNILQAILHMDESVPHLHVVGLPLYETDKDIEKLSYTHFEVDGAKNLAKVQTEYAESMKYLGYERGEQFSTRIDYSTHYQFRAREAKALDAELPRNNKLAKEAYKDVIVQLEAANMELEKIHATEKLVSKLRKREQELKEELQEKERLLEEKDKRIAQLEVISWSRECELKGMVLHPNKEMINNSYCKIQNQLIELGERYYDSVGVRTAVIEKNGRMFDVENQEPERNAD